MDSMKEKRKLQIAQEREIAKQLLTECGGLCMICGKPPDWRGFQLSHNKNKQMGGTSREIKKEDCELRCARCHAVGKHNIKEVESAPMWSKEK